MGESKTQVILPIISIVMILLCSTIHATLTVIMSIVALIVYGVYIHGLINEEEGN